ncbi:hypothetical protein FCV25MIE_29997, partial [Fagus crenata]
MAHQVVSIPVEFKCLVVTSPSSSFSRQPNRIPDRLRVLLRWLFILILLSTAL